MDDIDTYLKDKVTLCISSWQEYRALGCLFTVLSLVPPCIFYLKFDNLLTKKHGELVVTISFIFTIIASVLLLLSARAFILYSNAYFTRACQLEELEIFVKMRSKKETSDKDRIISDKDLLDFFVKLKRSTLM